MDQQRLAFADLEQSEDAKRRLPGDRQRRRVHPRNARRLGREGLGQRVLGVGAGLGPAEDLVAHGEVRALADGVDDPGDLEAGHVREGDLEVLLHGAAADLPVDRVDAGGPDGQPDLPRAGLRHRHLGQLQDVRPAVGGEGDRSHGVSALLGLVTFGVRMSSPASQLATGGPAEPLGRAVFTSRTSRPPDTFGRAYLGLMDASWSDPRHVLDVVERLLSAPRSQLLLQFSRELGS